MNWVMDMLVSAQWQINISLLGTGTCSGEATVQGRRPFAFAQEGLGTGHPMDVTTQPVGLIHTTVLQYKLCIQLTVQAALPCCLACLLQCCHFLFRVEQSQEFSEYF